MGKIQFTHMTGEPHDLATFLNEWKTSLCTEDVLVQAQDVLVQAQTLESSSCGGNCTCKTQEPKENGVSEKVTAEKPKRTRKQKVEKTEEAVEDLPTISGTDFIEVMTDSEEKSTEENIENVNTEEDLKAKAMEEAFLEVPKNEENVDEKATETELPKEEMETENITTDEVQDNTISQEDDAEVAETPNSESEVKEETRNVSFEMMKEAVKVWCNQIKHSGKGDPMTFAKTLFSGFGDSETGKAADTKPTKYSLIYDMVQDPATIETIAKMIG